MTADYKELLTTRIKDSINGWIDKLKGESPTLLLTKQWQVVWPKGFSAGHNVISVVTGCKNGRHLIGEIQFILPQNLELDMDTVELKEKNEPFIPPVTSTKSTAAQALDEPLEILNEMVMGVNDFLMNLNFSVPQIQSVNGFFPTEKQQAPFGPLSTNNTLEPVPPFDEGDTELIEKVRGQMLNSPVLPQWLKTIQNKEVWETLINKLVEGFVHYRKKIGAPVSLEDYFDLYTKHLLDTGKLTDYCKYKSHPVILDSNTYCTESYCSKKPYKQACSFATLKFGQ
jgi:hypothetical protein